MEISSIQKKIAITIIAVMVWVVGLRFILIQDTSVHYHANFAVFIDNERLPLDNFIFYEEVSSCGGDNVNNPKIRVHMHDQISHLVHVHDDASTWGHFFANLGMTLGDTVFRSTDATYVESDDIAIRYLLNDKEVQTVANRTIGDLDTLLISIGNLTDEEIQQQYAQIPQDASIYNDEADPAACSGSAETGFVSRLERAAKFWQ